MGVLVAVETVVLVLLVVLVAGLLRSHADILRALHGLGARVGDPDDGAGHEHVHRPGSGGNRRVPDPVGARREAAAFDVVGVAPTGEAVAIGLAGRAANDTLIAFLSSGCGTCALFWQKLSSGAHAAVAPARVLVVTRDPAEESESALARLAPRDVTVVMSSATWDEYSVPGSPYFVYVDGRRGTVTGEGTATRWDQLVSLCLQARADTGREARADRELLAAGIHPGHPSLYPGSER